MSKSTFVRSTVLLAITAVILMTIVSCGQTAVQPLPTVAPTAEVQAPAPVVAVRETVLTFLREGAIISVPPRSVTWHAQPGNAPDGFDVYQFKTDHATMTVSFEENAGSDLVYHVTYKNKDLGFCYQAQVNDDRHVINTGVSAVMMPELQAAAESYCTERGYAYEVQPQSDGTECGVCIFDEGDSCKAWEYYQGLCGPGEQPAGDA